ncbi:hypothetical protein GQ54DRAFT_309709 [Martensiomyces pterosporus]|nr:hypothetical protein GQ54DRAFT_309709 [Martensiomyces pterosporus]
MSQNLNNPWLCRVIADPNTQLDAENKSGYRVQVIELSEHKDPLDKEYPVCCEISDKEYVMRAAFSRKILRQFEKKHGQSVLHYRGMIIQIKAFKLELYDPSGAQHSPAKCPATVRASGGPQFWLLITKFEHLGGEGNSVFGESRFVRKHPQVRERLKSLATPPEPQEEKDDDLHSAQKSPVPQAIGRNGPEPEEKESQGELQLRKKQRCNPAPSSPAFLPPPTLAPPTAPPALQPARQAGERQRTLDSSTGAPTVGHVPFLGDMEAAWEFESMWQTLAIQQACIPFMPFHGQLLERPHVTVTTPRVVDTTVSPVVARINGTAMAPAPLQHPSKQRGFNPANIRARGSNQLTTSKHLDDLGGLLSNPDDMLVSADHMMNRFYGTVMSSPQAEAADDTEAETDQRAIDASVYMANSIQWASESAVVINK